MASTSNNVKNKEIYDVFVDCTAFCSDGNNIREWLVENPNHNTDQVDVFPNWLMFVILERLKNPRTPGYPKCVLAGYVKRLAM